MMRGYRGLSTVLVTLLCLAGARQSSAAETVEQQYAFAEHGSLRLQVPAAWQGDLYLSAEEVLPAIVFRSKAGAPFRVVVAPVWIAADGAPGPDRHARGLLVRRAAAQVQSLNKEHTIEIREFQGTTGEGYYFSAADRELKVGGYAHLTQGLLPVGSWTVAFTIYTPADLPGIVSDVLTMLKSAILFRGRT